MSDIRRLKHAVAAVWIAAIVAVTANEARKEAEMRQLNLSIELSDAQYDALRRRSARIGRGNWTIHDEIRTTAIAALIVAADNEIRREVIARENSAIINYDDQPIKVVPAQHEAEIIKPTLSEDPTGEPAADQDMQINITDTDLDLMARCVQAEAGNQSLEGKTAAAEAMRNRMRRPEWPDTMREVISQDGQFSVWATGAIWSAEPDDETLKAVQEALSGSTTIPEDYVYFNTSPIGSDCIKIGDHYFGR